VRATPDAGEEALMLRAPIVVGLTLAASLLLAAPPTHAATIVVDFAESVPDRQLVSFTTSGATFTTWVCASTVYNGYECDDAALYLNHGTLTVIDDALLVTFDEPVTAVSLDFGGDYPEDWQPDAEAWLWAFLGDDPDPSRLVVSPDAEARVTLNLDRLVNQSITIEGGPFQAISFRFVGTKGGSWERAYTIDNLRFETVAEPGTVGLVLLGAAAALTRRREIRGQ
jgi:hypothetical protein